MYPAASDRIRSLTARSGRFLPRNGHSQPRRRRVTVRDATHASRWLPMTVRDAMRLAAGIRAEEYLQSFRGAEPLNTTSKVRRHPGSPYQRALSPGGPPPFVILRGGAAGVAEPRITVLTEPRRPGSCDYAQDDESRGRRMLDGATFGMRGRRPGRERWGPATMRRTTKGGRTRAGLLRLGPGSGSSGGEVSWVLRLRAG